MKEELAKELLEKIINCKENWIKPWKEINEAEKGLYYENFAYSYDGRMYRGVNQMLLPAGLYLTFEGAKKRGFKMKKGSRGYKILVPKLSWFVLTDKKVITKLDEMGVSEYEDDLGNKYKKENGEWKRTWLSDCGLTTVFHHDCFENIPLPKCDKFQPKVISENANGYPFVSNYTEQHGIKIYEGGNECYYSLLDDSIAVPKMERFDNKEKFYLSLFHELVHSTGKPLKRKMVGYCQDSNGYAFEEVIAETGAVILGQELNVGDEETEHFAYLRSWSEKMEASTILKAITQGINAASFLLSFN